MTKAPSIIIVSETVWHSIAKDIGTFALVAGIIGTGWFLGSAPMQWIGFLMVLAMGGSRIANGMKNRLTPQQAADRLRDKFGVRAS